MDKLFTDVNALYRLDQTEGASGGLRELGPLPAASKVLMGTLAFTWVCIALYVFQQVKKQKKIEKND